MAYKFLIFVAAFIGVARAGLIGAPLAAPVAVARSIVSDDYDPNPQYSYGYDVQDALTGDSKSQTESRNGDVVQGSYSLTDADGFRRTVDYTADPLHGFNAIVRREPLVAKTVVAAPAVAKLAAPVAYAAPAAHIAYSAPAAHLGYAGPGAQLAYAAPSAHLAYAAPGAQLAYAAPAAQVSYAAPLAHAAYTAPSAHVAYSTSAFH